MKKLLFLAALAVLVAGCSAQQATVAQNDMNTILAYGPPYSVNKLQGACTASSQNPADKLLKVECVKLSVFAKGCELAIPQIAGKVNGGLAVASAIVPQVNAALAANQVAVPMLEAAQYQMCTAGGFLVGQATPMPSPSPAATPAAS